MTNLLDADDDVVVSGTVDNKGPFYGRFDHIVLLSAPVDVLLHRVSTRTTNPYGRTAAEQAERDAVRDRCCDLTVTEPTSVKRSPIRLSQTR